MVWEIIASASSGSLLVKLALSTVLIAAFLFLRKRETEGSMGGYAILAGLLVLRDLGFAFLPSPDFYVASELAVFGLLLYLATYTFQVAWALWVPLSIDACAALLVAFNASFRFAPALPLAAVHAVAAIPIAALVLIPLAKRADADTTARELSLASALPFGLGSLAYLAAGLALGPASPVYQGIAVPLFYGLIFSLGFFFVDITQSQLVSAVEYYEESIDSLYDLLSATGGAIKPAFVMQDVLDSMVRAVVERSGADGGIILLADEFEESVSVRALSGTYPPPFKLPESLPKNEERVSAFVRHSRFKLGEGILGEVAQTGKHVFSSAAGDVQMADNGDEVWLSAGALIAVPLIVQDRIIGAISVAKTGEGSFTERDFDRCKLLANFGSIAVANSFSYLEAAERSDIEREAAIAENIQRSLAPQKLPELPGMSFGAFTSPARGVCSDFYDVIQTGPSRAILAVGDVAGKGVAASLVLVMVSSILHLITNSAKEVAVLLQWVNRGVTGKVDIDHYATLGLVSVDSRTGEIEFSNAGHQPVIVYRQDADEIETIDMKSIPIGVDRGTPYASKRLGLKGGDVLVMYTDGIIEAMNAQGKQFGRKNLGNILQRDHSLSAREIAQRIRDDLLDFVGSSHQHDDQTVLVMKSKR